ncbi:hypothetical protein [Actinomycetospora cinnamomea]|uniref:Uncharacterized protein n=1 Tax=Actinomycetospora cinnamomea TaxID=663609 RepID=A0A2U1FLX9_9PSEU|nr:hypothetical protein [Actinomycetospora cinnamomea]PVZ13136.1 hypothetical protein C8D89_102286 [Actinomycetospora cinnamomea]
MSLRDKVQTGADALARKSMDAAAKGQAKVEAMQAKRRGDALLHDLGAAVYLEHQSGRTTETSRALLAELDQHAAEHGLDTSPDVTRPAASSGS